MAHAGQEVGLGAARALRRRLGLFQLDLNPVALRHIARRGEHALQRAVPIVERRRIVRHDGLRPIARARGQFVVRYLLLAQHKLDGRIGAFRVREVSLERGADQFVPRAAGQRLHLLVDVGDDPGGIRRHDRVDVRLDQ